MIVRQFDDNKWKLASALLFAVACFTKQFYSLGSGSFQLADLLFMGSFVFVIFSFVFPVGHIGFSFMEKDDLLLTLYFGCIVLINLIYTVLDSGTEYLLHTIYYVYIALILITFSQLAKYEIFLTVCRIALTCSIFAQSIVFFLGKGRDTELSSHGEGILGTFNDPNQCAFYMFSAFLLLYLIWKMTGKGIPVICFFVALYVIVKTGSMGNFLGMVIFAYTWTFFRALRFYGVKKWLIIGILLFAAVVACIFVYLVASDQVLSGVMNNRFTLKLVLKIKRFLSTDGSFKLSAFIEDRAWNMVVDYPEYLLFGSGEGNFSRFYGKEVHNSVVGPMFYYGLGPWVLWAVWYMKKLFHIRLDLLPVYIALFAESFLLMNCRQPFFWMILISAGHERAKRNIIQYSSDSPKENIL